MAGKFCAYTDKMISLLDIRKNGTDLYASVSIDKGVDFDSGGTTY